MTYEQAIKALDVSGAVRPTGAAKTGSGEPAIEVAGVTRRYGKTTALRSVSFAARAGAVTALLGPNGAGKTTMIRILSTLLRPDAGTARVGGHDTVRDPQLVQAIIGLTGQALAVDGKLSGLENLTMFGRLHRLPWPVVRQRSARLLEAFGLSAARGRAVKTFSGGMRRKLDLAVSLMAEPPVLFLDEPTTGLDPDSRDALWDIIRDLVSQGTTVLLTTQYLNEADALADSVVFIDDGQVVASGTPADLKAQTGRVQLDLIAASDADLRRLTAALEAFKAVNDPERRTVRVAIGRAGTGGVRDLGDIVAAAVGTGAQIERLALHEPDLDDVYRRLTGGARSVISAEGPA
jgi:daunorubicin resistance ABC transporter ATP-binding subunit